MTGPLTSRTEPRTNVHLTLEELGPPSEDIEPKISVIIPTFNESSRIADLISRLDRDTGIEIIVVDGGSADGTPEIVESSGCRLIRSVKGRACQMNAGAAVANGRILLFLHADTVPSQGFADQTSRQKNRRISTTALISEPI